MARWKRLTPEEKQLIRKLKEEWFTLRDIAKQVCKITGRVMPHSTVQNVLAKPLREYEEQHSTPSWQVGHMRHKTKLEDGSKVSVFIKNPQQENRLQTLKEEIIHYVKTYAPKYPKIERKKSKDWHLLVIDPADIHIGKLASAFETGEDYNNQIAVARVLEWVQGILDKTHSYNIEKILFIGGNDVLHIDNPKRTTTSGTPQDTDGMWYDTFMIAKKLYITVLEQLISVADVHFVYNPSNHDYTNGFFLCQTIESWFSKNKNITFDTDMKHRKYYQYGKNLIGTTHGDGAKNNDLALLAATEQPVMRSNTKRRYFYTHHVHHKTSKDYMWFTVESLRSPSWADSRHSRNWYIWKKAIEWFIHHPEYWQICRFNHYFG